MRDQWQDTLARTDGALTQTEAALAAIPDPTDDLAAIARRLTLLDSELAAASADVAQRRSAVAELRRKQAELAAVTQRIDTLRSDLRRADAAIAAIGQRIAGANELAQSSDAINAGLRQLDSARAELERLESARREYDNLRTRRNELQSAIDREHAALAAEASQLERRIREELQPMPVAATTSRASWLPSPRRNNP